MFIKLIVDLVTDSWKSKWIVVLIHLWLYLQLSVLILYWLGFPDPLTSLSGRSPDGFSKRAVDNAPLSDAPSNNEETPLSEEEAELVKEILLFFIAMIVVLPMTVGMSSYQKWPVACLSLILAGGLCAFQWFSVSSIASVIEVLTQIPSLWPFALLSLVRQCLTIMCSTLVVVFYAVHIIRNIFTAGSSIDYDRIRLDSFRGLVQRLVTPRKFRPVPPAPWWKTFTRCCSCALQKKKVSAGKKVYNNRVPLLIDHQRDGDASYTLMDDEPAPLRSRIWRATKQAFKKVYFAFTGWLKSAIYNKPTDHELLFEESTDFYFPTRILITAAISLASVGLVAIIVIVGCYNIQLKLPKFFLWLNPNFDVDVLIPYQVKIIWGSFGCAVVAACMMALNWYLTLSNFKRTIFRMRQGNYDKLAPEMRINTYSVTTYVGYQIAHCLLGFVLVFGLGFILVAFCEAFVAIAEFRDAFWGVIKLSGFSWLIRFAVDSVVRYIFTTHKGRLLRFRHIFQFIDLCFLFLNTITGVFSCVIRIMLALGLVFINVSRLDVSITPSGWATMDGPFASYMAVVIMEHNNNNPIVTVFLDDLWRRIEQKNSEAKATGQSILTVESPAELRSRQMRMKWQLLCLLARNPSLRKYRKHRIRAEREAMEEARENSRDANIVNK